MDGSKTKMSKIDSVDKLIISSKINFFLQPNLIRTQY